MSSSDLYLSFDRGVINATPRPLITGMGRSLSEVVKHLSLVNLAVDTSILTIIDAKALGPEAGLAQRLGERACRVNSSDVETVRAGPYRSQKRGVGKECGRKCICRWLRDL